jgi:predicted kinase
MFLFDELFSLLPVELQEKLINSPQDRNYHSEGNVYNHIKLVSMQLPIDDINYQLCALFHDIGKPEVVEAKEKIDKIRIRNIGHENYCEHYINRYKSLYNFKYNCSIRYPNLINWEMIIEVCNYHMRMHDYNSGKIIKSNKRKFMEELKYFEELKIFAKADEQGRIENSEIANPYLICLVGIPGSGKSFWVKSFSQKSGYNIVCPDEIRAKLSGGNPSDQTHNKEVWELAYHTTKELLTNKKCVIFDSTLCNLSTLKSLVTIAKEKEAIIMFKIFDTPIDICKERISTDISNGVNRSNVPTEIIDKMANKFPDVVKYITDNNMLIIKE